MKSIIDADLIRVTPISDSVRRHNQTNTDGIGQYFICIAPRPGEITGDVATGARGSSSRVAARFVGLVVFLVGFLLLGNVCARADAVDGACQKGTWTDCAIAVNQELDRHASDPKQVIRLSELWGKVYLRQYNVLNEQGRIESSKSDGEKIREEISSMFDPFEIARDKVKDEVKDALIKRYLPQLAKRLAQSPKWVSTLPLKAFFVPSEVGTAYDELRVTNDVIASKIALLLGALERPPKELFEGFSDLPKDTPTLARDPFADATPSQSLQDPFAQVGSQVSGRSQDPFAQATEEYNRQTTQTTMPEPVASESYQQAQESNAEEDEVIESEQTSTGVDWGGVIGGVLGGLAGAKSNQGRGVGKLPGEGAVFGQGSGGQMGKGINWKICDNGVPASNYGGRCPPPAPLPRRGGPLPH